MPVLRPNESADELTTLTEYLERQRQLLLLKAEGLDLTGMTRVVPPSTLTIGGIIKHMALVENSWFRVRLLGDPPNEPWMSAPFDNDPDWEFNSALFDVPAELIELYQNECESSREAVEQVAATPEGLDSLSVAESWSTGRRMSLRWVLLHMIEETARHVGHADILRQAVDGSIGDGSPF